MYLQFNTLGQFSASVNGGTTPSISGTGVGWQIVATSLPPVPCRFDTSTSCIVPQTYNTNGVLIDDTMQQPIVVDSSNITVNAG